MAVNKLKASTIQEDNVFRPAGKIAQQFMLSDARCKLIAGAVGSGKSTTCIMHILQNTMNQPIDTSGYKRARWAIIRTTYDKLERTAMKTWKENFPEEKFGDIRMSPPPVHRIVLEDQKIQLEVYFLALNTPEDYDKLTSFELTGFWINEVVDFESDAIILTALSRIGRYPAYASKPDHVTDKQWKKIFKGLIDTNFPPTPKHWLADSIKKGRQKKHNTFEYFEQPSGLSDEAENLHNLPPDYYTDLQKTHPESWVNIFIKCQFDYLTEGNTVYKSFWNSDIHIKKKEEQYNPFNTLYVGIDFGLTPAVVFLQKNEKNQWVVLRELVTPNEFTYSAVELAQAIKETISLHFNNSHDVEFYGDPAGEFRNQSDGISSFDVLRRHEINVIKSPTQDPKTRIMIVSSALSSLTQGLPKLMINKHCSELIIGFTAGYKYSMKNGKPMKNEYSHVHDALQYILCGAGEYADLKFKGRSHKVSTYPDWQVKLA